MGKAIIIPEVSFQPLGLGQVHFSSDYVKIICPNVIVGTSYQVTSTFDDVVWSVESSAYASIDADTGLLSISQSAAGHTVKIIATLASDPLNKDEFDAIVIYSSSANGTFDDVKTVAISGNLRNGSAGNPNNAMRVCSNKTIDVLGSYGARYVMITTTRPNTSGYKYFANIELSTLADEVVTSGNFYGASTSFICELGRYGTDQAPQDAPMDTIFPLFEDTNFQYGCASKNASGLSPVSFAVGAIQESTDSYYSNCRALRTTDFANYDVKVHYLK